MGRTVIAEENLKGVVDDLYGTHRWQIGLIVGQLTTQRDFILHLARSPDTVEDEAEIESCKDDSDMPPKQDKKQGKKSLKLSLSEEIDEKWITEHARQVNRMLPGGLNIIGVYIFSSPEFVIKNQAKLRQCIIGVHKVTERNKIIKSSIAHNDRILLHICSTTRKLTCRTMDISDNNMALRPAEFKYQSFLSKWNSVKCSFGVDVRFHIPVSSEKSRFEIQILQGLQQQLEEIWDCIAIMDGKALNDDELLVEQTKSTKGKSSKEQARTYDVEFYTCQSCSKQQNMVKMSSVGLVKFIGKLYSQAYLHTKASKGEAVKALKCDIIRSILSRLQLLCEEAEVNNLYQVDNWSLVSPMRVFLPFKDTPIKFCDYVFKDEQVEDSLQRFSELLDISASGDSLVFNEESPDNEMAAQMMLESGSSSTTKEAAEASPFSEDSEKSNFVVCLIGVLVAIIAALFSLIYMR